MPVHDFRKVFGERPDWLHGKSNDAILKADHVTYEHYGVQPTWRTFRDYFARLRRDGFTTFIEA